MRIHKSIYVCIYMCIYLYVCVFMYKCIYIHTYIDLWQVLFGDRGKGCVASHTTLCCLAACMRLLAHLCRSKEMSIDNAYELRKYVAYITQRRHTCTPKQIQTCVC